MKKTYFSSSTLKFALIFVMVLLFLIPISLINYLTHDRQRYRREAISSILEPLGYEAGFQGTVIAVPYKSKTARYDEEHVLQTVTETKYMLFAPEKCSMDITADPYYLTRGIFKVPVFNGKIKLSATFKPLDYSYFHIMDADISKKEATLLIGLSNNKKITKHPALSIGGRELSLSPLKYDAKNSYLFNACVCYTLEGIDLTKGFTLTGDIDFQGGESIKIRPMAQEMSVKMDSSWKTPGFSGGWLPTEREIDEKGFSAEWNVAGLSTVYPAAWLSDSNFEGEEITVSFVEPVNSYQKSERSIKYALLFLIIPFIALLISEIFSKTRVHPVQYFLIGLSDVLFYLLLLSVSEHLPFDLAYLICAAAVSAVTLFYAAAIFAKFKWGAMLGAVQMVSYIFLYGTLQAEDYALLIGSVGLFVVTVLLMYITRKIDWYGIMQREEGGMEEASNEEAFWKGLKDETGGTKKE